MKLFKDKKKTAKYFIAAGVLLTVSAGVYSMTGAFKRENLIAEDAAAARRFLKQSEQSGVLMPDGDGRTSIITDGAKLQNFYGAGQPTEQEGEPDISRDGESQQKAAEKKFIKWVEFNIPYQALERAMKLDIEYYGGKTPMPWVSTLSVLACRYGGDFSKYRRADLDKLEDRIKSGETFETITENLQYYGYYKEAYGAVLDGFLGEFDIQAEGNQSEQAGAWERKYGLKAFFPLARGYDFGHYDDFGAQRTYGYARRHLGHDLLGNVGTPVVAIESGTVEAIGWNQYGGWRVGIRSFDTKRYYYYAHLRKNHPYHENLAVGQTVMAGDVIGYLGRTGYSAKENVNNIKTPHLHVGMQLIFDESQKDSPTQIWIDLYDISRLLSRNRSAVYKNEQTKDYFRKFAFCEDIPKNLQSVS